MDLTDTKHYLMFWALAIMFIITYRCAKRKLDPLSCSMIDYSVLENFGYLRLITIAFLVCVFSCIECKMYFNEVEVDINPWKILQSFIYTFLVIIGIDIESSIYFIPWCSFTMVNLVIEGHWLKFYIMKTFAESIFPFKSMFWTVLYMIWFVKVKWWKYLLDFFCTYEMRWDVQWLQGDKTTRNKKQDAL